MKSFAEATEAIADSIVSLRQSSIYTLDRIEKLLDRLGNPQEKFKTVHIAGTSGKTSTAYYISAMLEAAGYNTGLSVSPHINEINERVQLGLEPISEREFCSNLEEFIEILNKLSIKPTYFELFIAFAYWYFAKQKVDYAVIETGLGGLLDGTNVVRRTDKICVITDIGLDHMRVLGDDIAQIAVQKAGIIQHGNQVFIRRQTKAVDEVIIKRAQDKKAPVHFVQEPINPSDFQQRNWSLAKSACEYILNKDDKNLSKEQWERTKSVIIPGRMETMNLHEKTIVLDGAHNAQKMKAFIDNYRTAYPGKSTAVLLAVAKGRDIHLEEMAGEINKISNNIMITSFGVDQDVRRDSIDASQVAEYFAGARLQPKLEAAVKQLLSQKEDVLLVTGSLYLVSAVRKILKQL